MWRHGRQGCMVPHRSVSEGAAALGSPQCSFDSGIPDGLLYDWMWTNACTRLSRLLLAMCGVARAVATAADVVTCIVVLVGLRPLRLRLLLQAPPESRHHCLPRLLVGRLLWAMRLTMLRRMMEQVSRRWSPMSWCRLLTTMGNASLSIPR